MKNLLGILIVGLVVLWFVLPERWTNPVWYGAKYRIAFNQVHTNDKPSHCDWMHAPLGSKGCYYDRVVIAYNAAGEVLTVDAAMPKRSRNKDGNPIISYDDGKTWQRESPDTIIKSVEVDWNKVTEPE